MNHDFDIQAFTFVERIKPFDKPPKAEVSSASLKGMSTIDLGEVKDFKITEFDEEDYSEKRRYADVNGKMVGLNEEDFRKFSNLVQQLMEDEYFQKNCTFSFLLDVAFEWLLDVYKNRKAEMTLTDFIYQEVQSSTRNHCFYFKIDALAIEEPFKVGNGEIMYFTESETLNYYEESKKKKDRATLQEFKIDFGKFFDSINMSVRTSGVYERAKEIAFYDAELAMDVLKCFLTPHSVDKYVAICDLDFRHVKSGSGLTLNIPNNNIIESRIELKNHHGVVPCQIDKKFISWANSKGLPIMSKFISTKKNDDLYIEIRSLIRQLSEICSTKNNYEKIVKAISLLESIAIPESSGKAKGEKRIKDKIIPKIVSSDEDNELVHKAIRAAYLIRDKYLHNYVLLDINRKNLQYLLEFARLFIIKLIKLNDNLKTIEEIHKHFELI